jgi:MoxR-like ATPase
MHDAQDTLGRILDEVGRVVVGQRALVEGLLVALLSGGHALVDGVPGLAKTTAVRTLAQALGLGFGRIQFTPDLLPGDLLGTLVFVPDQRRFQVHRGPIFAPVLLALPDPFFVMATQNPVELEGTYPLPEAQVDRFLLKLVVPYPEAGDEREIVSRDAAGPVRVAAVADAAAVVALRAAAAKIHVAPALIDYAVRLVRATRDPSAAGVRIGGDPKSCVALGASPRASIYLVRAARARALLDGRGFVTPHDLKRVAPDVLRHRVVVSFEAEADGISPETVVAAVLATVETA